MKKIINGKIYDTETATEVASWDNGYYTSDFNWCMETLYVTKKGNWFIYGEGGPASEYKKDTGSLSMSGEGLITMSKEDAFNWLEDKNCTKALEKYFSDDLEEA